MPKVNTQASHDNLVYSRPNDILIWGYQIIDDHDEKRTFVLTSKPTLRNNQLFAVHGSYIYHTCLKI